MQEPMPDNFEMPADLEDHIDDLIIQYGISAIVAAVELQTLWSLAETRRPHLTGCRKSGIWGQIWGIMRAG